MTLGRIELVCTASQLAHAAHLLRIAQHPNLAHAHAAMRPAKRPQAKNKTLGLLWWRYAIHAVITDLREERLRLSWRWLRARILMQRAYELAYHASLARAAHGKYTASSQHASALALTAPSDAAVDAAAAKAAAAARVADGMIGLTPLGMAIKGIAEEEEEEEPVVHIDLALPATPSPPREAIVRLVGQRSSQATRAAAAPAAAASSSSSAAPAPTAPAQSAQLQPVSLMEWIEQALDVQTIAKCRERVEGRLFAPRLPPAGGSGSHHNRSLSAPPSIQQPGKPPPKLQLHVALRLRALGTTFTLHPRLDTDSARIEVTLGELGLD